MNTTTTTESTHAELEQFGMFHGHIGEDNISVFTLTGPLSAALGVDAATGKERENALSGKDIGVVFNDPVEQNGGTLVTGVVKIGEEIEDGRTYSNQRRVSMNKGSLQMRLPVSMLEALDAGDPPVIDVWAGDGVIQFKTVQPDEIAVGEGAYELSKLPDRILQDALAVIGEGKDPGSWGVERGLSEETTKAPRYVVQDNIERAEEILGGRDQLERAVDEYQSRSDTEEVVIVHTGQTEIRGTDTGNFLPITSAIQEALADPTDAIGAVSDGTGASLHFHPKEGGSEEIPSRIETGADAQTGTGLARAIDGAESNDGQRFQIRMPDAILRELGIDPDNADGERVILRAAEDHKMPMIVLSRPNRETREVPEPELKGQYDLSREEYIDALQDAAAKMGEPLTVRDYRKWKQAENPDAPTYRKIVHKFRSYPSACKAAGLAFNLNSEGQKLEREIGGIEGVGQSTLASLIHYFGETEAVLEASQEQLQAAADVGPATAQRIHEHLNRDSPEVVTDE